MIALQLRNRASVGGGGVLPNPSPAQITFKL